MSSADITRQYASVAKPITAGTAVPRRRHADRRWHAPLTGIPLANITLLDAANAPVVGIQGPFFFGAVAISIRR